MRATWYVLEDGTPADPAECTTIDGVLVHESGARVAMRSSDCPMSTGVDLGEDGHALFGGKGDHDGNGTAGGAKPKDIQAEQPRRGYKTRESKAR